LKVKKTETHKKHPVSDGEGIQITEIQSAIDNIHWTTRRCKRICTWIPTIQKRYFAITVRKPGPLRHRYHLGGG